MRTRLLFAAALSLVACGSSDDTSGAGGASSSSKEAASASSAANTSTSGAGASSSTSSTSTSTSTSGSTTSTGGSSGTGLASMYPGDVGIGADPAVVWHEDFEEGSVDAVVARYTDVANQPGMELVTDIPAKSGGASSMKWTSDGSVAAATHVYTSFPDQEEIYARWYAKYQPGGHWHHTGVWIGGYAPASSYPNPQAGLKPNGDDRFSVSIEPIYDIAGASPRLDTYDYWMTMHSWMDQPMGDTAYYGNALVNRSDFTVDEGQWICVEVHVKLNTDLSGTGGAMLEVWKNDALFQHFDETGITGYWLKDKFCATNATGSECTDYPPAAGTPMIPLDLQWRSTDALKLNAFWPQNYVTDPGPAYVEYDDMVVATKRIGCLE